MIMGVAGGVGGMPPPPMLKHDVTSDVVYEYCCAATKVFLVAGVRSRRSDFKAQ